ncbi:hypothetical protein JXR01_03580 [Candidatus Kaiserbacteria bacterium]|nr:MAG: hypothetical protein JXR01_03580 [Candidatus Kaiserbacteria bacterium]
MKLTLQHVIIGIVSLLVIGALYIRFNQSDVGKNPEVSFEKKQTCADVLVDEQESDARYNDKIRNSGYHTEVHYSPALQTCLIAKVHIYLSVEEDDIDAAGLATYTITDAFTGKTFFTHKALLGDESATATEMFNNKMEKLIEEGV